MNIQEVKTTGIELGLTYNLPETPFSGFLNGALTHAYGTGLISGGFLDFDTDGSGTDLDHDQRLSITTGFNYQPHDWFYNLVGIYGSGLANGNPDAVYKNGLFDFNTNAHTDSVVDFQHQRRPYDSSSRRIFARAFTLRNESAG